MVVRYAVSNENRLADFSMDFSMDFSKVFFESRIPSALPNGNNLNGLLLKAFLISDVGFYHKLLSQLC